MVSTSVSLQVLENGDISSLPQERQTQIQDIKNKLDLSYQSTLNFGNEASSNLSDFSNSILQHVKVKDIPEVEGLLTELVAGINKVDTNTLLQSKKSLFGWRAKEDIKKFMMKYDDIESVMVEIKGKLKATQMQLEKDISICESFINQNFKYINDLDNFILAGVMKRNEVAQDIERRNAEVDPSDSLAIQELNILQGGLERLDRKIFNLRLMREIAIQNIPQIRLIQDGDCALIEKIQSSIDSAVPLWESQIVIAVALAKQKSGVEIQNAISQAISTMYKNNSELTKSSALDIARQIEEGIIDMDTLSKGSQNLIDTINGVRQIMVEGVKKREKATAQLAANQERLARTLIESSTSSIRAFGIESNDVKNEVLSSYQPL